MATKEVNSHLKRKTEALVVSGDFCGFGRAKRRCLEIVAYTEDGTVELHKWIAEVPWDAPEGLAKARKEDTLDEEYLPRWTSGRVLVLSARHVERREKHSVTGWRCGSARGAPDGACGSLL